MQMQRRMYSEASAELQRILKEKIPQQQELVKKIKAAEGETSLGPATVGAAYGGMRGVTGLTYEPSLLDPVEGIRFRGLSIPECQEQLPKALGGTEPLPEAMWWLLLTGEVPTDKQVKQLQDEFHFRATSDPIVDQVCVVPTQLTPHPNTFPQVSKTLDALPTDMHPMLQFSTGLLTLGHASKFAKGYADGTATKANYWEYALDDSLDLLARVPQLAAQIYRRSFHGGSSQVCARLCSLPDDTSHHPLPQVVARDPDMCMSQNFTNQMGFESAEFADCMRLYLSIHTDHEGGNVSAHTTTLVGSALSDPYLSCSAGMNGLAGPLHGLANQEVLLFLQEMQRAVC